MEKVKLSNSDALALQRTRLANERTFLAYFRTSIVFLSSGFAIIKIKALTDIIDIGYFLLVISPILLVIGIIRSFYVKSKLKKYYNVQLE